MPDRYQDFASLAAREERDVDFRIVVREGISATAIVAPHGGGIEFGTSEIARAVAGTDHTFYAFEGLKRSGNSILHVTSTRFDEPLCLATIERADRVVTIHGERSEADIVFLGGLDLLLAEHISASLTAGGFTISAHDRWAGSESLNLCNRGRSRQGVQLELSRGLRRSLLSTRGGSGRRVPLPRLDAFAAILRAALE